MDESVSRREILKVLAAMGIAVGDNGVAHAQTAQPVAAAPAAKSDLMAGGRVVFENDKVRVIEHLGRPRLGVCGTGWHSHPAHLTVLRPGG